MYHVLCIGSLEPNSAVKIFFICLGGLMDEIQTDLCHLEYSVSTLKVDMRIHQVRVIFFRVFAEYAQYPSAFSLCVPNFIWHIRQVR